jgi:hypothetical protein
MNRFLIDEHIRPDSVVVRTYLARTPGQGDKLTIEVEPGTGGVLSAAAVVHVMKRYAKPLDEPVVALLASAPTLELPSGAALHLLHWRAQVDAAGRDWLVLTVPDEEPIATLASGVSAAFRYLVARLADERAG